MREYKDIIYDKINNKLDIYFPNTSFFNYYLFYGGGLKEGDKTQENISSFLL